MPQLAPWQRGVLHTPGASRSQLQCSSCMCPAGLPSLSQPHPSRARERWDGRKSRGGLGRVSPRLQAGLGAVFGGGTHQETVAAFCTNPIFCKSVALCLQKHAQTGGGGCRQRWRGAEWR